MKNEDFEITENKPLTAQAVLDELRTQDRQRQEKRLAELEAISPVCSRSFADPKNKKIIQFLENYAAGDEFEEGVMPEIPDKLLTRCGHKLNRHGPCSLCGCPGFLSESGDDAGAASSKLIEERPDLFPPTDPSA